MTDTAEKLSPFATASELAASLRIGATTSTDIVRRALDRAAMHEGQGLRRAMLRSSATTPSEYRARFGLS